MANTIPRPASSTTSSTLNFTTDLSQVRLRIGDTGGESGTGRIYLSDEQIYDVLDRYPTVLAASIECVRAIMAIVAKDVDKNHGGISSSSGQVFEHYKTLLEHLERESGAHPTVFIGGISTAAQTTADADTDYAPIFKVGMHGR